MAADIEDLASGFDASPADSAPSRARAATRARGRAGAGALKLRKGGEPGHAAVARPSDGFGGASAADGANAPPAVLLPLPQVGLSGARVGRAEEEAWRSGAAEPLAEADRQKEGACAKESCLCAGHSSVETREHEGCNGESALREAEGNAAAAPLQHRGNSTGAVVPEMQSVYIKTFGCSHNQSDSEYMAGQLAAYGYRVQDTGDNADLWLINTCTVKNPSQSAMDSMIRKARERRKPIVLAGCVPQGDKEVAAMEGVSVIGVQQIDRVVEVVEETLKGHQVRLLQAGKRLPSLHLPKVRRNKCVEIVPISTGCLGSCTYCKTKHARGHLGSYRVADLVERVQQAVAEGVTEIWLSSEDTGAYGRDIGSNLPELLNALVQKLPTDRRCMLRVGMTNPPFILEHLPAIAAVLRHPCVFEFLHIPVQSASNSVLKAMQREYTVEEFCRVVDTLRALVPGVQIATDIISGFPGETEQDHAATRDLLAKYQFAQVHISQFYPRPGTPAARMKRVPTAIVKNRTRELTALFEAFSPYVHMLGRIEPVWITDWATDRKHLVGHTKGYIQVLISPDSAQGKGESGLLGRCFVVKIVSVGRWSVAGEVQGPLTNEWEDCAPREDGHDSLALSWNWSPAEKTSSGISAAQDKVNVKRKGARRVDDLLPAWLQTPDADWWLYIGLGAGLLGLTVAGFRHWRHGG